MRLILTALLMLSATAQAAVYKCVKNGQTSYADQPCDAAAQPAELPPLNTIAPTEGEDRGKRFDERVQSGKKARDAADATFVKDHAEKTAREKAVRKAIIDHEVIKGMMASEVESALGSADEKLPDGAWRYRRDGQRITVRFEAGQVSGVSIASEKKKK